MSAQILIARINDYPSCLKDVKRLGDANSGTLGFFTEGAFTEKATQGHILIALTPQRTCVGYLLYRPVRRRLVISITHLCVDAAWRHHGIARALLRELHQQTKHDWRGIELWCRRDYEASSFWPKLGFQALTERPGRGRDQKTLTLWWLDHGHKSLLNEIDMVRLESKLRVVIDANVFFDLVSDDPTHQESRALLAPWLQSEIELCVTPELFNEINRGKDHKQRKRHRREAEQFIKLESFQEAFEDVEICLRAFFPEQRSESDASDLRQVARAIAAEAPFFVTRDVSLSDRADQIYEQFGLHILCPSDLITHLDELRRESEYRPAKLAGTGIVFRLVQSREQDVLIDHFQCSDQGENRNSFRERLRGFLSNPEIFACYVAEAGENTPLALFVYERRNDSVLNVPLFRTRRDALAATVARHLIIRFVRQSIHEERDYTRISEPYVDQTMAAALQEDGFFKAEHEWFKFNCIAAETAEQLALRFSYLDAPCQSLMEFIEKAAGVLVGKQDEGRPPALFNIERVLWPVKIIDTDIPTYIVPIDATWAMELFDESLAAQTLLGNISRRVLNKEGAYYRSAKGAKIRAPGRILWYVSQNKKLQGTSSIRACSQLDDVVIGKPKDLFRQFRHLGVYEWQHISRQAKHDLDCQLMVLRFSHTELFNKPIGLRAWQRIVFETEGKSLQPQGPSLISSDSFAQIYRAGVEKG